MPDDTTATPQPHTSDQFAAKLIEDLGLTNAPEDKKTALIAQISALADQEILYAVTSRLTDQDIEDLEQYLDEDGTQTSLSEQAFQFLQTRIPHLEEVIKEALVDLYDRLMQTSETLTPEPKSESSASDTV